MIYFGPSEVTEVTEKYCARAESDSIRIERPLRGVSGAGQKWRASILTTDRPNRMDGRSAPLRLIANSIAIAIASSEVQSPFYHY